MFHHPAPSKLPRREVEIQGEDESTSSKSYKSRLPDDIESLSLNKRIECIRQFWKDRRDHPLTFQLREIRDLSSNADKAMKTLFPSTCKTEMERIYRNGQTLYRCCYKWYSTQSKWIFGLPDKKERVAKLSAAIAALKTILGADEFTDLDRISASLNFRGMRQDELRYVLLSKNIDTLVESSEKEHYKSNNFYAYDVKTYSVLTPREKENIIVNFWSKFFHQSDRSEKFPVVFQLLGFRKISSNAADAFKKLFPPSARRDGNCWWRVDDEEHELWAEDDNELYAQNAVATKALRKVLGDKQFKLLAHMSQPFFWKDMDVSQIRKRIERGRKNEIRAAVETDNFQSVSNLSTRHQVSGSLASSSSGTSSSSKNTGRCNTERQGGDVIALEKYLANRNEQKPEYTIAQAFHVKCEVRNHIFESMWYDEVGAKSLAAMQAIEHLWGSKLPDEIVEIDLTS